MPLSHLVRPNGSFNVKAELRSLKRRGNPRRNSECWALAKILKKLVQLTCIPEMFVELFLDEKGRTVRWTWLADHRKFLSSNARDVVFSCFPGFGDALIGGY